MHHAAGFNYKEPGDRRGREHGGTEKRFFKLDLWQQYGRNLFDTNIYWLLRRNCTHAINWSICPFGLNSVITSWRTQLTVFTAARQSWVFSPNKSEISRSDRWKLKPAKSDKTGPFHHSFSSSHRRLSSSGDGKWFSRPGLRYFLFQSTARTAAKLQLRKQSHPSVFYLRLIRTRAVGVLEPPENNVWCISQSDTCTGVKAYRSANEVYVFFHESAGNQASLLVSVSEKEVLENLSPTLNFELRYPRTENSECLVPEQLIWDSSVTRNRFTLSKVCASPQWKANITAMIQL